MSCFGEMGLTLTTTLGRHWVQGWEAALSLPSSGGLSGLRNVPD